MVAYLAAVWRCRYFWLSLVKIDLRTRYRGSALGIGWSLLHPIAMTAIICTVFSTIFHQDIRFFAPYLMAGLTFWAYLVNVSIVGCQCFFHAESYIRQYPAPAAIYPLRTMLGSGFHFLLSLLLVLVLSGVCRGLPGALPLLSLLPTIALLLVFGWSLAVLFGLATVRFRDTHHLSEVLFQVLFYLTPVMYTPDLIDDRKLTALVHLNPLTPFLVLLREPILDNRIPSLTVYLAAGAIVLLSAGVATTALRREERQLIFNL
jgi:ABC-type polysaccharide/polyol phosphate export permease